MYSAKKYFTCNANLKNIIVCLILLLLVVFFTTPSFLYGQAGFGELNGSISLSSDPKFPGAREVVNFEVTSFSFDLNRSRISWYINGVFSSRDVGKKTFSYTTGKLGSRSVIKAVVESPTRGVFEKTLTIIPANVDLLWEAETYTPPFYKGKGLPSSNNKISITAIPFLASRNGRILNPEDLIYTWKKNETTLLDQSGLGKRNIKIDGPLLFEEDIITVDVSSFDGSINAHEIILIEPHKPQIVFYIKDPLLGTIYEKAVGENFLLTQDEFILRAEPYFFPKKSFNRKELEFVWSVNNQNTEPQKDNELTLRKKSDSAVGSSNIRLRIRDLVNLQQAALGLLVNF